jgi:starch phosphorylase
MTLRAEVLLGGLGVGDVAVQAVLGRVDSDEQLHDVRTVAMAHVGSTDGRELFEVETALPHSGAAGYTVRVLPANPLLAGDAELGLVALA